VRDTRGLAVVVVLFMALVATTSGRTVEEAIATLRAVDLEGRTWSADRLRGRVTLIDFWATWCAPCLTELPYLKQARATYPREEFEILGVSFDVSDRRALQSWLNRQGVDWPQVFDGRGRLGLVARHFGIIAVPTSFLIGADGQVAGTNLRGKQLLNRIEKEVRELRASR